MADETAPGCRDVALSTVVLLLMAVVLVGIGLGAIRSDGCSGWCETLGLASLYSGAPVSALFGVAFGGLVGAWPLDVTVWVVAGFWAGGLAGRRGLALGGVLALFATLALAYGLVLSQFVEIAV